MSKLPMQKPHGKLNKFHKWVFTIGFLAVGLFVFPVFASSIQIDLKDPSLPLDSLYSLRLAGSRFISDLVYEFRGFAESIANGPTQNDPSVSFTTPLEYEALLEGNFETTTYDFSANPTFVDVPFEHWAYDYIEALYQAGYIAGCTTDPLMYCPERTMNRAESAVFIERGIHGANYLPNQPTKQIFADVPLNEWFAKWTNALWEDGYTTGCGTEPPKYCPLQELTRTEGTVFFLRMLNGPGYEPPTPLGLFADVPVDFWGAKWIEAAYNADLISACETGSELRFCPMDPLDRAMGAYMMFQARDFVLPTPTPTQTQPPLPSSTPMDTPIATPTSTPTFTITPNPTSTPTSVPTRTPTPLSPSPTATSASSKMYYIAPNGDDSNPGTIEEPWGTLSPVHARDFLPGEVIHFKRGGVWSGGLVIDDSGVQDNPIIFTAYGTGDKPVFSNPGGAGSYTRAIVVNADWVVIEGFLVQDAHEAGIYISNGSDHNIVRDIEATNVGIGVAIHGQYNLATRNYVHDLHMVVNTQGGDDDYGAVGLWMFNSNNEVSYNRIVNCKAPSYDYGSDGGAIEWYGVVDNSYVHHNWASGCDGFLEVSGGSVKNAIVAYNISINNGGFSWIHLGGTFASEVENFRVENNTIVERASPDQGWLVIGFGRGDPNSETFLMRNNILWIEKGGDWFQSISNKSGFTHEYNLYNLIGGIPLGYSLGEGERLTDLLFVNINGEDFHLQSGSPAIDAGVNLGYSRDFDGSSVPYGIAPDIGALEYRP